MDTVTVTEQGGLQSVQLPKGIRLATPVVTVRQEGDRVVLEPVKTHQWPRGFFESIRIADPEFGRPPQGETPAAKEL